ncbi:zinc finger MYM-type protein 6 [Biomphalaria glabrata]|nr:zinc finger MYM-type protein 6-like [Biomphalaria glabrata]
MWFEKSNPVMIQLATAKVVGTWSHCCPKRLLINDMMVEEIRGAAMFSVQIDTTQDINVQDQCSIVIRYVTDTVHERVIAIVNGTSTTGKGMCDLVCSVFEKLGIDVSKCIGNSTDGASNMQGQYNGFNAWLNTVSPGQIHVWSLWCGVLTMS